MLVNQQFYNQYTRKYIIIFGTLFNNIRITREDADGNPLQALRVPVAYGPRQKYLAIVEQYIKANGTNQEGAGKQPVAITLPRMAFEIVNMQYDSARKLPKPRIQRSPDRGAIQFTPVPYDINLQLSIMTKNAEDGPKIYEQILPFFGPEFNISANLLPEMGIYRDIPIILNGIKAEDTYESDNIERRSLIWTLDFTMKVEFGGPIKDGGKVIKNINIDLFTGDTIAENKVENLNIRPGLTVDGQPTTDPTQTVPYTEINVNDNWDFIETVTEYFGE